jgi:hypothetical protein
VREALLGQQLEEPLLLGVRAGKARLDQREAEAVERVRDAQLLLRGQRHALALHAVAQGGVVDEDALAAHAFDGTSTRSSHSA